MYRRSVAIIRENQAPSGAYVASPNFPVYRFCWFRDSSYIAYAMDLSGGFDSSERFHDWAAAAINRRRGAAARVIEKAGRGQAPDQGDLLHTRYTLDGEDDGGKPDPNGSGMVAWENYQLDGFGAWLWALEQHVRLSGCRMKPAWLEAAGLVSAYLKALWKQPCYDCWEEFPEQVHTHTLAAIYGGLSAYTRLAGELGGPVVEPAQLAKIRDVILTAGASGGRFTKALGVDNIDASLLGLSTPFRVVEPDDPRMVATVDCIQERLLRGGVHRYPQDTYYGGGEWVLLAGWLGWYLAEVGRQDQAQALLSWMHAQADASGGLPEQVPATLNDPAYFDPWVSRWGPVAQPLLWSHAMYIILSHQVSGNRR